ncbi:MAG: hypothetical protein KKF77_03250 [Proteobacteria bacterium]|nr:hypothetical protein [Pseudomonadota bacterium]
MRAVRPTQLPCLAHLALAALLALSATWGIAPAQARKAAPKAEAAKTQPKGEKINILGRVAVGLDKTFIKDQTQGYLMVQGLDLTRFAGRHIQGTAVVVGQERDFRVIRLLDYNIKSPDDDSPGSSASKK